MHHRIGFEKPRSEVRKIDATKICETKNEKNPSNLLTIWRTFIFLQNYTNGPLWFYFLLRLQSCIKIWLVNHILKLWTLLKEDCTKNPQMQFYIEYISLLTDLDLQILPYNGLVLDC